MFLGSKMCAKVELPPTIEPSGVQTSVTAAASSEASSSSKISMFTAKSGFVIPKNKLSGSLVPIFRGSKKPGGSDVVNEESTKEVQRETKWGPDLTQDPAVRTGRALAYQTRVDQITKQLSVELLETDDSLDSPLAVEASDLQSPFHRKSEESELLELEKQEAIGEILKLNPSYKAPPDYKPSLKEAKVHVPIKEYPSYNFIGIIFDPASGTQKRLEKETGAKIQVFGTKVLKKQKIEIISSDGNEFPGTFEELYVQISADTYEKVDAAVALIEMLVTPVSVNQSAVSTPTTESVAAVVEQCQGTSTTPPFGGVNQEPKISITGSVLQAPRAKFQPYSVPWFPVGGPPTRPPSGFFLPPNPNLVQPSSSPFNPSSQKVPSLFGPLPFRSQNPSPVVSRPQPPVLQHPFMGQPPSFDGQYGPPRNLQPGVSATPPFTGTGQPSFVRSVGPSLSQPMPIPTPIPTSGTLPPLFPSQGFRLITSQPIIASGAPPSNISMANLVSPRPMQSSPPIPLVQVLMMRAATPNTMQNHPLFGSNPIAPPVAPPPPPSQGGGGIPTSVSSGNVQSFTPIKPQHPTSRNFTFQPHWPHNLPPQAVPRPGTQPPLIQNMRPINLIPPPPQAPQTPSFRPATIQMNPFGANPTTTSTPLRNQTFSNPNSMPPNSVVPQMGLRNLNPTPFPPPSPGIPPSTFQAAGSWPQSLPLAPNQHHVGLAFGIGSQQIYDPFSPTSVSAPSQGGDPAKKMARQESDPEYEDLMASVGVK